MKKSSKCLRNLTGMSRINTQMSNTHAGFVTDHLNRMEVNANMKFHTYPPGTSVSIVTVDSILTANLLNTENTTQRRI